MQPDGFCRQIVAGEGQRVATIDNSLLDDLAFRHRALGAVIGSAVGDALGAPFEFGKPCEYSKMFPRPVLGGTGEMIGNQIWEPGEFTDDTQMAIVQAESILTRGGIDGADLFKRFQVWAADAKDVGVQTRAVLGSHLPWNESAQSYYQRNPNNSAGNGSLMRATPTAVRFATASADETVDAARQTSIVTHGDPAAGWGTALFHLMIRAAVRGNDLFAALDAALADLPSDQARYREMLDARWQPANTNLPNGTVWTCLAQAVWAVRRHADSFADAVTAAIDLGGDTDTVAAVTGALAGARVGIQGIPIRWMTYVHGHITTPDGRRTYRAHDLQDLTMRLLGDTGASETPLGPRRGPTEIRDRGVCGGPRRGFQCGPQLRRPVVVPRRQLLRRSPHPTRGLSARRRKQPGAGVGRRRLRLDDRRLARRRPHRRRSLSRRRQSHGPDPARLADAQARLVVGRGD